MASRTNLLQQSEALSSSPWAADADLANPTITTNNAVGPLGGASTADQFAAPTGNLFICMYSQVLSGLTAGNTYCFSIYAKWISGDKAIALDYYETNSDTDVTTTFVTTASWQRFSITFTYTVGGSFPSAVAFGRSPADGQTAAATHIFWGAQVNPGSTPDDYIFTGAAAKSGYYADAVPGAIASGTGAVTPTLPANYDTASTSYFLILCETANEAVTVPAGWTAVGTPIGTGTAASTTATRITAFYAAAGTSMPSIADPGDHLDAVCLWVSGASSSNPFPDTPTTSTGTSSTSVTIPAITTSLANEAILGIVANATDTATAQGSAYANAGLSNIVEIYDANTTQGNGGGLSVFQGLKATAGSTGTTSATLASASVQARMTIAIAPTGLAARTVTATLALAGLSGAGTAAAAESVAATLAAGAGLSSSLTAAESVSGAGSVGAALAGASAASISVSGSAPVASDSLAGAAATAISVSMSVTLAGASLSGSAGVTIDTTASLPVGAALTGTTAEAIAVTGSLPIGAGLGGTLAAAIAVTAANDLQATSLAGSFGAAISASLAQALEAVTLAGATLERIDVSATLSVSTGAAADLVSGIDVIFSGGPAIGLDGAATSAISVSTSTGLGALTLDGALANAITVTLSAGLSAALAGAVQSGTVPAVTGDLQVAPFSLDGDLQVAIAVAMSTALAKVQASGSLAASVAAAGVLDLGVIALDADVHTGLSVAIDALLAGAALHSDIEAQIAVEAILAVAGVDLRASVVFRVFVRRRAALGFMRMVRA